MTVRVLPQPMRLSRAFKSGSTIPTPCIESSISANIDSGLGAAADVEACIAADVDAAELESVDEAAAVDPLDAAVDDAQALLAPKWLKCGQR